MKGVTIVLLLVAAIATCVYGQQSAQFNQALGVNASAVTYAFQGTSFYNPLAPSILLTVSSSSATSGSSSVTVGTYTSIPTGNISFNAGTILNNGLPAGYFAFSAGFVGVFGAGLQINFTSDINGNVNAVLNIGSSFLTSINASIFAAFRPLAFNAATNTYAELPPSQYNASASGGITIYFSSSISIIMAYRSPVPLSVSISGNAVAYANVVANEACSFAVTQGSRTALYIYNLTASAGTVSISVSANSNDQGAASGNVLISNVYTFNHSSGGSAVSSATFQYDMSQSGISVNATLMANAQWYYYNNGQWQAQSGSTVQGSVVIYQTSHFSDWSVQSNSQGRSGAASTLESAFSRIVKFLF